MRNNLKSLSQDELFRVLRNLLKSTQNELLTNLKNIKRVQALFNAIKPVTWKKACEKHFELDTHNEELNNKQDLKAVYLHHYPKHRLTVNG